MNAADTFSYSLLSQLEHVKDNPLPPVHLWHPENSRDIDMLIKEDGSWHYMTLALYVYNEDVGTICI